MGEISFATTCNVICVVGVFFRQFRPVLVVRVGSEIQTHPETGMVVKSSWNRAKPANDNSCLRSETSLQKPAASSFVL